MSPSKTIRVPSYRQHKASGQAIATINGRMHYLGVWGTPESKAAYRDLIVEHLGKPPDDFASEAAGDPDVTVEEVIAGYWEYAQQFYVDRHSGRPTSELAGIRVALRFVRRLFADCRARDFGPLKLKQCRQAMIDNGLSRNTVNGYVSRIKRAIRWAAENEIIPSSVLHGLQAVSGLRRGRTEAKEGRPVLPVPGHHVTAILPYVSEPIRAMVELQLLTGARPGEIVRLRPRDVERPGLLVRGVQVWLYRPSRHKNDWRNDDRTILLGPRAQGVLAPFLDRDPHQFCFSSREAEEARNKKRRAARKTKLWLSHSTGQKRQRRQSSKRKPKDVYTVDSYRRAVRRACAKAGVTAWHPHQLRHTAATRIRREYGAELARVALGHQHLSVTEIYAERDLDAVARVMVDVG